jgi:hypothetical protein
MKEPTAWINKERDVITFDNLFPEMTPLYEKREWVDLTDEEVASFDCHAVVDAECVRDIERKIKEKNT